LKVLAGVGYISRIWGRGKTPWTDSIFLEEDIGDLITCFKFGDDRFRGLASAEVKFCHFPLTLTAVLQT